MKKTYLSALFIIPTVLSLSSCPIPGFNVNFKRQEMLEGTFYGSMMYKDEKWSGIDKSIVLRVTNISELAYKNYNNTNVLIDMLKEAPHCYYHIEFKRIIDKEENFYYFYNLVEFEQTMYRGQGLGCGYVDVENDNFISVSQVKEYYHKGLPFYSIKFNDIYYDFYKVD